MQSKINNERKKEKLFVVFAAACFVLAKFEILSFNVEVTNGVVLELLYIPMVLAVLLLFFISFEWILDMIKKNQTRNK
jgi:hypothetical protein